MMFSRFDKTPSCDRWTNGQTHRHTRVAYAVQAQRRAVKWLKKLIFSYIHAQIIPDQNNERHMRVSKYIMVDNYLLLYFD